MGRVALALFAALLVGAVLLVGCGGDPTGSELGDTYDAYGNAGGPMCGQGPSGGSVYCKPGDHCLDQQSAKCATVRSGAYDAYSCLDQTAARCK